MPATAMSGIGRTRVALAPCATVLVVVAAAAAIGLRGADYPAQLLRAVLWDRTAASVWNFYWYGGHPTPSYSVLTPVLSTVIGPFGVAAIGAVAATWCFSSLTRSMLPSPTTALAGHVFAVAAAVNVIVGRAAFSLGLAVALVAVLAWHRRRFVLALLAGVLVPLASPVAAVFLAIAAAAVAIAAWRQRRHPAGPHRRLVRQGVALATATLLPVVATSSLLPEPGRFPFRGAPLIVSLVVLVTLAVVARSPEIRIGAGLSAIASIGLFVVPNPMGGNFLRLAQIVAVPLAIAVLPGARAVRPLGRRGRAVAVAVASIGTMWSVQPAVDAAHDWVGDPSIRPEYHRPLIDEVRTRNADGSPMGRLEIPFTENHWESLFVATEVPYARGWERQVDLVRNAALYLPDLTLDQYHDWLLDNAVRWIAVPDVPLDESGANEARLIAQESTADIAWLRPVWGDAHWRLYEVLDARPIVDPPATLVSQEADRLTIRAERAATVTIRYRYTPYLVASGGACLRERPDGWIIATFPAAGEYVLGVDPVASLLGDATTRCD